jgi:methionine biosynthesis protein MetW
VVIGGRSYHRAVPADHRSEAEIALAGRAHAYENPRPEVQVLVPPDARRVLDLGCSSGSLGAALKARQGAEVVGVEREPVYAARAEARLDRVVEADLETFFQAGGGAESIGEFDCVIAADVLEHLRDPWEVLAQAAGHLRRGGTAVVSLPNIRYWRTFWMLGRRGTWPVENVGIFDRTHLRFFTLGDARTLIERAGLRVETVNPQLRRHPHRAALRAPGLLGAPALRPFFAFQYVISARRD